jgi:O-glycosyl hydrolase
LVLAVGLSSALAACGSKSHDVTVNWSDTRQTIDGFGASSAFFGQSLTTDQADQLFDSKKGIGISLLRTMIGVPADTSTNGTEPTTGADPVPTAPELTRPASRDTRLSGVGRGLDATPHLEDERRQERLAD